ncbi:MAG: sensor histidine kinase [Friedmanniella sp.]|jgi:signal transduction histidine kinase
MPRRPARVASRAGAQIGVRTWSVLVAVVVVLLALLAGGGGLVYILQLNLEGTASSTASSRAAEVAEVIRSDGVRAASERLVEESRSGQFVQIVGPDQRVVGASNRLVADQLLTPQRPAAGETAVVRRDIDYLGEGGDWMVVSRGVSAGSGVYVVNVAIPVRVQRETVQTVAAFLLAATPLLLAAVAGAVWLLVGRALRSVERIRTEVATIDAQRLAQRVEVPATHDEIAALAATMNVMLDRLEVSHQAQRAFVSDASHELRSPLATLTTAAELATNGDEATRTRLLGTITVELARLRGLVENLMTLARADARDLLAVREEVDLDDLVDGEVRRLRATSDRVVLAALEPIRVLGDGQRLEQALRNLVDNAERHARSTVRLDLHRDGDDAVVWVDNDGPAIQPADRERVFERFVRLDDSRSPDAGGSGLGLPIARTTLAAHGGEVSIEDAPDGWCRFVVRLPPAAPHPADPAAAG